MAIRNWIALVKCCREQMREIFVEKSSRCVEVKLFKEAAAVNGQLLENIQHCCGIFFYDKSALQKVK